MKWRLLLWCTFFGALVVDIHRKGGGLKVDPSAQSILFLVTSFVAVLAAFVLLELWTPKKSRSGIVAAVSFLFGIACYFTKRTAFPFSYSLGANNYDWVLSMDGIALIGNLMHSTFFASDFFWSILLTILIFLTFRRGNGFLETLLPMQKRVLAVTCLVVLTVTSFVQPYSYDPISNYFRSVRTHYIPVRHVVYNRAEGLRALDGIAVKSDFQNSERPNVYVVIVESFNSRFVHQKTQEGVEYTPFFNRLTETNLYFPNYFSNSVQTSKGHFAALCGQVPMLRSIEFKNSECFTKKCLAMLLSDHGYETSFIQADPNFSSEGVRDFMLAKGFQQMPELVQRCDKEKDRCYGIGIRDDLFYGRALDYLEEKRGSNKPQFAVLATVASHMPFSFQPQEERLIHTKPKNLKEHYLNMLKMVDSSLEVLVNRFRQSPLAKNSILIITGDHGFPTGEHGSYHNENYAYSENFGVPLLIMDFRQDLKKKYSGLEKKAFSHLNLGPTIVDLAGLSLETDFIAPSIFSQTKMKNPIYLVQPYSGGYQVALEWPLYYIFEEHKEREYLFDMDKDPAQKFPLPVREHHEVIARMRADAGQIYRQQDTFMCSTAMDTRVTASALAQ